jgi:hypothetical protein
MTHIIMHAEMKKYEEETMIREKILLKDVQRKK